MIEIHTDNVALPVDLDAARMREGLNQVLLDMGRAEDRVNVIVLDDEGIRMLNRTYRGIDVPTDVLAFDLRDEGLLPEEVTAEVYVSLPRAAEQADQMGVPLREEVVHLAVHGLLHLAGFDDATAPERRRMEDETVRYVRGILDMHATKNDDREESPGLSEGV